MIRPLFALLAGFSMGVCARADDAAWLTRPADPTVGMPARRLPSVTAGLKRFRIVEPKDWLTLNRAAARAPSKSGMKMPGNRMSGAGMPGMKMDGGSMPGMDMHGRGKM